MIITFYTQVTLMKQRFLRSKESILELGKTISSLSGFKTNFTKSEVVRIGFLKGVKMVVPWHEIC